MTKLHDSAFPVPDTYIARHSRPLTPIPARDRGIEGAMEYQAQRNRSGDSGSEEHCCRHPFALAKDVPSRGSARGPPPSSTNHARCGRVSSTLRTPRRNRCTVPKFCERYHSSRPSCPYRARPVFTPISMASRTGMTSIGLSATRGCLTSNTLECCISPQSDTKKGGQPCALLSESAHSPWRQN